MDTSVTVPALAAWHEAHAVVSEALTREDRLPEHVALETYAVLTRLPPPYRLDPAVAAQVIARRFPPPHLALSDQRRVGLLGTLAEARVAGGATYDGLVGLTAVDNRCALLTRDARARVTYARLGVDTEGL